MSAAPTADDSSDPPTVAVPLDSQTKATVQAIPLLSVRSGPRDGAEWIARLKQELNSLIAYVNHNKKADNDWFIIEPNKLGTKSDRTTTCNTSQCSELMRMEIV